MTNTSLGTIIVINSSVFGMVYGIANIFGFLMGKFGLAYFNGKFGLSSLIVGAVSLLVSFLVLNTLFYIISRHEIKR